MYTWRLTLICNDGDVVGASCHGEEKEIYEWLYWHEKKKGGCPPLEVAIKRNRRKGLREFRLQGVHEEAGREPMATYIEE